jgi:hypothetical protein
MRKPMTVKTLRFGSTLGEIVRARTALPLDVVKTTYGHVVTDPTHLRFNATYNDAQTAEAAAFLAMARRAR